MTPGPHWWTLPCAARRTLAVGSVILLFAPVVFVSVGSAVSYLLWGHGMSAPTSIESVSLLCAVHQYETRGHHGIARFGPTALCDDARSVNPCAGEVPSGRIAHAVLELGLGPVSPNRCPEWMFEAVFRELAVDGGDPSACSIELVRGTGERKRDMVVAGVFERGKRSGGSYAYREYVVDVTEETHPVRLYSLAYRYDKAGLEGSALPEVGASIATAAWMFLGGSVLVLLAFAHRSAGPSRDHGEDDAAEAPQDRRR